MTSITTHITLRSIHRCEGLIRGRWLEVRREVDRPRRAPDAARRYDNDVETMFRGRGRATTRSGSNRRSERSWPVAGACPRRQPRSARVGAYQATLRGCPARRHPRRGDPVVAGASEGPRPTTASLDLTNVLVANQVGKHPVASAARRRRTESRPMDPSLKLGLRGPSDAATNQRALARASHSAPRCELEQCAFSAPRARRTRPVLWSSGRCRCS